MKNKQTLWQRIVFLEEQLTEAEKRDCRNKAYDETPITKGFKEPCDYFPRYLKGLKRVYREKGGGE